MRLGYTPTGYILDAQDWADTVAGVNMAPPQMRDWADVLILMAPCYHTAGNCGPRRQSDAADR